MRDMEGLVKEAAAPIDHYIREVVQRRVVQRYCEGGIFCGKMCNMVRHKVEMLRLYAWQQYVKWN